MVTLRLRHKKLITTLILTKRERLHLSRLGSDLSTQKPLRISFLRIMLTEQAYEQAPGDV